MVVPNFFFLFFFFLLNDPSLTTLCEFNEDLPNAFFFHVAQTTLVVSLGGNWDDSCPASSFLAERGTLHYITRGSRDRPMKTRVLCLSEPGMWRTHGRAFGNCGIAVDLSLIHI